MNKFQRSDILYTKELRQRVETAVFGIAGLGAVGSYATESLARFGAKNFVVVDCDTVDPSNINRQLFALETTVGMEKRLVARGRILSINSEANVEAVNAFIAADTLENLFGKCDIIIDAIDCISSKCDIAEFAQKSGKVLVSSMGAARRKDLTKIRTGDFWKVCGCPVAARMRKELKKRGAFGKFDCVFSDEQLCGESHLVSSAAGQKKVIGSSPFITAAFGIALGNLAVMQFAKNRL